MKVTPRLPAHGHYSEQFVEMRYIRYGEHSVTIALLFGLFEELHFAKVLRKRLGEKVNQISRQSQRVVRFLLDSKVSAENVLAVWNHDQFPSDVVLALREAFQVPVEVVIDTLTREIPFQPIKFREEFKEDLNVPIKIRWDIVDQSVVLLYNKHTTGSFVRIKECRHVHLKSQLLLKLRQEMGKPFSQDEPRSHIVQCGVNGCTDDVAAIAMKVMQQLLSSNQITSSSVYRAIVESSADYSKWYRPNDFIHCQFCQEESGYPACSNGCKICNKCAAIACLTRSYLRCPCCGERILKDFILNVLNQAKKLSNFDARTGIICDVCRFEKPESAFGTSLRMDHPCFVCEDCKQDRKCSACGEAIFVKQETRGKKNCRNCHLSKEITCFAKVLRSDHSCLICDQCLTTSKCPSCSGTIVFAWSTATSGSLQIRCHQCHQDKYLKEFGTSSRLSHWWKCRECDICFSSQTKKSCRHCMQPYSQEDLRILETCTKVVPIGGDLSGHKLCSICRLQRSISKFRLCIEFGHNDCIICDECHLLFYDHSNPPLLSRCPGCRMQFPDGYFTKVIELKLQKPTSYSKNICRKCEKEKDQSLEMEIHSKLTHSCIVCDACLKHYLQEPKCPACSVYYCDFDKNFLWKLMPSRVRSRNEQSTCLKCSSPVGRSSCKSSCLCGVCILEEYLETGKILCTRCNESIPWIYDCKWECANCLRPLYAALPPSERGIAAFCTKFHTLCILCVNIKEVEPLCGHCKVPAKLRAISKYDIHLYQARFKLGCQCDQSQGQTSLLRCGHPVHNNCIATTYTCRMCFTEIRPKLTRKTLREFLPSS